MSGAQKKAKTGPSSLSEMEESHAAHLGHLRAIRSHLSDGSVPGVPADCAAARAVLRGIAEEASRSSREHRLRTKFERERIRNLSSAEGGDGEEDAMIDGDDGDDDDGGWQDVTPPRNSAASSNAASPEEGGEGGGRERDLRSSPELMEACSSEDITGDTASPLGQALAEQVTRSVADARIRVAGPVAAIALALHAAMRTDVLGFRCTGIPDDDDDDADDGESKPRAKSGGFAAPIRELPKTKFLPDGWDSKRKGRISLRYRKDGVGATVLRVTQEPNAAPPDQQQPAAEGGNISIMITSSTNSEPAVSVAAAGGLGAATGGISFDASQRVNLAGLAAAITSERARLGINGPGSDSSSSAVEVKVSPVLHYLDLAGLMTALVTSFDLGSIRDPTLREEEEEEEATTMAAAAVGNSTSMEVDGQRNRPYQKQPNPAPAVPGAANPPRQSTGPGMTQPGHPPRIEELDPSLHRPGPGGGDFGGDLAPGGILDPSRGSTSQVDNRGSLMGPNHPAFRGPGIGGEDDFGFGGGLEDPRMPHIGGTGMTPRFDLYYPPGIGPDLGRGGGSGRGMGRGGRGGRVGRGRRPPGGDPNPDHLKPPNSFNSDMFM